MFEGVPGSGKSYYAVSERFLKWLRAGRRIYIYVDGLYTDKLAVFEGRTEEELKRQITIWNSPEEVRAGLPNVEPGSSVLIDEVQTVFRSKEKTDPDLLRWLETHRHRGIDIVLMCQQYGQVTLGVNRLIETTTKFRRLDRFGLKNRYQAAVRGNPEEVEVIRMFTGKYEPKLYAYYASYSSAAIRESQRGGTILKSPTVIVGLLGLIVAGAFFSSGQWLSGAPTEAAPVTAQSQVHLPRPEPLTLQQRTSATVVTPVRIAGSLGYYSEQRHAWEFRYLSEDGKILTLSQIVGLSGGTVREERNGPNVKLVGDGVIWQPVSVGEPLGTDVRPRNVWPEEKTSPTKTSEGEGYGPSGD